jgi:hypothetical protein
MRRIAYFLRKLADRIDYHGAPKAMGWSFTFEKGIGIVFRQGRQGCPIWYYGEEDYIRAHTESDTDWEK